MARRKRRHGFGLVKHSGKKISRSYYNVEHTGKNQPVKRLNVQVRMQRASRPTNTGRTAGYWASACFGGKKSRNRYMKCGPDVFGRSPTIAAKRALVALGKSSEVK